MTATPGRDSPTDARRSGSPLWIVTSICLCAVGALPASGNSHAVPLQTDQRAATTARLDGIVVDAASGLPLSHAAVTVNARPGSRSHTLLTDQSGRFTVPDLPVGRYEVVVRRDGYLPGAYGQMWPRGSSRPFELFSDSRSTATIALWRLASISGRLVDDDGNGIPSGTVQLWSTLATLADIDRRPAQPTSARVTTDETGAFTFGDLEPATYYLGSIQSYRSECNGTGMQPNSAPHSACRPAPSSGSLAFPAGGSRSQDVFATTFYPGVPTISEAEAIALYPGEQRTGLTIMLESHPSVHTVGVVTGPTGPVAGAIVSLIRSGNGAAPITDDLRHAVTTSDSNGRFVLAGVVPGNYEIRATYFPRNDQGRPARLTTDDRGGRVIMGVVAGITAPSEANPVLEALVRITVERDRNEIVDVALRRATTVRGTLQLQQHEPRQVPPSIEGLSLLLQPLTNLSLAMGVQTSASASGAFEFASVPAATYRLRILQPRGLLVGSVDVDSRPGNGNVIDVACCGTTSIVVTLVDPAHRTAIRGVVRGADGKPSPAGFVFVFPSDPRHWGDSGMSNALRTTPPSSDGSFTVDGLPNGVYSVIAVSDAVFPFDWRNRQVLSDLSPRTTQVAIRDGAGASVTLRSVALKIVAKS